LAGGAAKQLEDDSVWISLDAEMCAMVSVEEGLEDVRLIVNGLLIRPTLGFCMDVQPVAFL